MAKAKLSRSRPSPRRRPSSWRNLANPEAYLGGKWMRCSRSC
jgi:hypothetical protein